MKESFYCLRFHILYQVHNFPHKWHCSPALMHSQNLEIFTCISFMYIYAPFVHWIYCLNLNIYIDSCSTIRTVMTMNTIIQGRSKRRQGTYGHCWSPTETICPFSFFHLQHFNVHNYSWHKSCFHDHQDKER